MENDIASGMDPGQSLLLDKQCSSQPASPLLRPGPVLLLVLAVLLLVSWWRSYARFRRMELAMPGPRTLPVIGSALEVAGISEDNALAMLMGLWGNRFSELSRCAIFNRLIVFATDPDHIAKVMRDRRFKEKSWFIYSALSGVLGEGLVTSSGAHWKRHRAYLQPAFHLENLERYVELFAEEAAALVAHLRDVVGKEVEYCVDLDRYTCEGLLRTCMPSPTNERDKADFEVMIHSVPKVLSGVTVRTFRPWVWPTTIFDLTSMGREQAKFNKLISDLIGRIMKQIKSEAKESKSKEASYLTANRRTLQDMILDDYFTPEEVYDEVKTLFGAALETSSTALAVFFKIMSIRPDIQERVFKEIHEVCGDGGRLITSADLPRLQYMDRVFKETLRLYPVAPFFGRYVSEDVEVDGKMIPAGATMLVNIMGVHRDPRHHPDPLHFDPDRFLHKTDWHPYSYMPFGAGQRKCIGKPFAMLQMKTVVAATLRAYRLLPVDDGITEPSQIPVTWGGITLGMAAGTKIRFEPRDASS